MRMDVAINPPVSVLLLLRVSPTRRDQQLYEPCR